MMSKSPRYLSLLMLAATAIGAQAEAIDDPYVITNRSPFVQIYGLPAAQSAQLAAAGSSSAGLQLDISNNFTEDNKGREAIFIDGETHRANIQFRYGFSEVLELGIDVPYLSHDSGSLDSVIEDWHDFFGFPDGGRPDFPRDQLQFSYARDGQVLSSVTSSNDGIGDVSVSMAYQLSQSDTRQWALRSAVKLPTGDADDLHGSESTDLSLGFNVSDQGLLQNYNIALHASAGAMWMDGGEVLEELQEDFVLYGSSTLSWQATSSISLKIQLDAHTAFYDSALTELGDDSAQLILGGAIRLGQSWVLDLAVSEDIAVDTAPDVVFHIGIKAVAW
ncbi:DUF3187 family protein [Oceanicoccus sagamiensis]|uniref:DUF3187 domain-containing protein n=1 Tax=Oceanicoccus sagamiensis TaxID=716816 RepID=A0A1X9NGS5_9GAMM|nr:DUF3187 family protein [Oceanicoccus sagamiensis]ARN74147.1 hypothetical protein BST96_08450 [Oceanicoccus sagamiensis]